MIPDTRPYKLGLAHRGCSDRGRLLRRSARGRLRWQRGADDPVAFRRPRRAARERRGRWSGRSRRRWRDDTGPSRRRPRERYTAQLDERPHSATVAIVYDATNARIDYVDSTNLAYENGPNGEVIHRNYNTWVKNLASDIKVFAAQAPPPTAQAPPPATPAPAPR